MQTFSFFWGNGTLAVWRPLGQPALFEAFALPLFCQRQGSRWMTVAGKRRREGARAEEEQSSPNSLKNKKAEIAVGLG